MTRFADQLFDDLMREHGPALARVSVQAARQRHVAARPVLLAAGAGGVAVAATVGMLAAGGGSPAYAVTTHPDGTVTLAVYQQSGITGANARLHQLGDDRVVVVPVEAGCPSIDSLPAPGVPAAQISLQASGSSDGTVTVDAHGVPAGDILVVGFATTTGHGGQFSMTGTMTTGSGHKSGSAHGSAAETQTGSGSGSGQSFAATLGASRLTSGPVPSCISLPAGPGAERANAGG